MQSCLVLLYNDKKKKREKITKSFALINFLFFNKQFFTLETSTFYKV